MGSLPDTLATHTTYHFAKFIDFACQPLASFIKLLQIIGVAGILRLRLNKQ